MELKEILQLLKKNILFIIILPICLGAVSLLISIFLIKPTYTSDISILLGNDPYNKGTSEQSAYNDVLMYQKMTKTYSEFVQSRAVAEDVIKTLNLDMSEDKLTSMITTAPKADTEFLKISVSANNPDLATDIVNQVAKSLEKVSKEVKGEDNITILDTAQVPRKPSSPNIFLNTVLAIFLGFLISTGIVLLRDYLDNTIKKEEDIEALIGLTIIGSIPLHKE